MADKTKIAVIGAGLMGAGIAQVFAAHGHEVRVYDPMEEARASMNGRIRANLKILGQDEAIANMVAPEADLKTALLGAVACFEAAPEKLALKQSIFAELEVAASPDTILASNTSVIPITNIARKVKTSERVLGTHWWNPPYLVPLVEVVPTKATDPSHTEAMMALLTSVGKKPVQLKKDVPGFVGNRLQHAMWREAHALIADGVCDAQTVDDVVKNSFGMRLPVLGPIENADMIGLELTKDIHASILPELKSLEAPSSALDDNIAAGRLGFQTGKGFRDWSDEDMQALREKLLQHLLAAQDTA